MKFKYRLRVEDASSVFDGEAEIVNNSQTDYLDTLCFDPGKYFWKFIEPRDYSCQWDGLKKELMEKWRSQSNSVIES